LKPHGVDVLALLFRIADTPKLREGDTPKLREALTARTFQ